MTTLSKDEVVRLAREAGYRADAKMHDHDYDLFLNFYTLCRAPLVAELEQAKKEVERLKKDLSTVDVILEECKMDWSGDVTQIKAEHAHGLLALQAERDDWKARALKAEQAGESTPNDVVAGALYDFLGYLTSRRTRVTMSDRDEAGPAVDALVDWSKTRKITLEEARVEDWQNYTTPLQPAAQEPTSAVTVVELPAPTARFNWNLGKFEWLVTFKHSEHHLKPLYTRDQLLAYGAAQRLAGQQWLPIESAPQGTMILCANMKAREAKGWCFVAWVVDGKVCGHRMDMPTHWQPLPPPPASSQEQT